MQSAAAAAAAALQIRIKSNTMLEDRQNKNQ
jgi:hypothetical protein